jgi:hypothetical protein
MYAVTNNRIANRIFNAARFITTYLLADSGR